MAGFPEVRAVGLAALALFTGEGVGAARPHGAETIAEEWRCAAPPVRGERVPRDAPVLGESSPPGCSGPSAPEMVGPDLAVLRWEAVEARPLSDLIPL
jgi:hypothetical protein